MSELIKKATEYRAFIELAVQDRPDEEAVHFICLHPFWQIGMTAEAGKRYQHNGKLYKCKQTHMTQENWEPGIAAASLFEEVNEINTGDDNDPIPYDGNMELIEGKVYIQNGVKYLCTRSTGIPVYNALADLVGIYVQVVA